MFPGPWYHQNTRCATEPHPSMGRTGYPPVQSIASFEFTGNSIHHQLPVFEPSTASRDRTQPPGPGLITGARFLLSETSPRAGLTWTRWTSPQDLAQTRLMSKTTTNQERHCHPRGTMLPQVAGLSNSVAKPRAVKPTDRGLS